MFLILNQCFIFSLISLHFKIKPSKFSTTRDDTSTCISKLILYFILDDSPMIISTYAHKRTSITRTAPAICRSRLLPILPSLLLVHHMGYHDIKESFSPRKVSTFKWLCSARGRLRTLPSDGLYSARHSSGSVCCSCTVMPLRAFILSVTQ
jgi:hypothetical protein